MNSKIRISFFIVILYIQLTIAQQNYNVIFFLVDDLGWADLGCYGSPWYETPNVDRLAEEGMRFVNAYAASPVSSPTRSAIMTGKNPARTQITQWMGWSSSKWEADYTHNMPLSEVTIAEALKDGGYKTGYVGKWHLGETAEFWPENQGFDTNIGGYSKGHPPSWFSPYNNPRLSDGPDGEHLTERLAQEATHFIETHKENPFLLYFALYQVHTPLAAQQSKIDKYKAKQTPFYYGAEKVDVRNNSKTTQHQKNATYAAMVEHMDDAVGLVLDKIKTLGLENKTIVFFTGDNGGLARGNGPTSVFPLYAGKAWIFEGGIREPLIVKWPGKTKAGSISDAFAMSMDFYPTILEMLELPPKPSQHADGKSLVPVLKDAGPTINEPLFFHYPHYHGIAGVRPSSSMRLGDYKLIEFIHDNTFELYNLKEDPRERVNLTQKEPNVANQLRWILKNWRDTISANMPPGWPRGTYTPPANPGAQAILSLTEPWGPKLWKKGSQQLIKWHSIGDNGQVQKIAFSYSVGDDENPLTGTVKTSSQRNDTLAARFAFDNDLRTRWAAEPDGNYTNEWLEIDFQREITINKVRIKECDDWGKRIGAFKIQAWKGSAWRDVHSGNQIGPALTISFDPILCTKARLLIQNATGQPTIWELGFFHYATHLLDSIPNSGSYQWTIPDSLTDSITIVLQHRISKSESQGIALLPVTPIQNNQKVTQLSQYALVIQDANKTINTKGNFTEVIIFNLQGRIIQRIPITQNRLYWNGCDKANQPLAKGMYWTLFIGSSSRSMHKFMIY